MSFRKFTHLFIYYLVPTGLMAAFMTIGNPEMYEILGNWALWLLSFILFVKPVAVITKIKFFWKIISYRRELGILTFWLAFFHFFGMIYAYQFYKPEVWGSLGAAVYWGAAAALSITIVAMTSNNFVQKLLKRNWKRVQSLSYFVLFAVYMHVALIERELVFFLIMFGIFFVLKMIEFRKYRSVKVKSKPNLPAGRQETDL